MEGKKDYKCDVCNKFYKNYKSLWKHKYVFHKVDDNHKLIIDNHLDNHNIINNIESANKHYECRKCKKPFSYRT